MRLSEFSSPKQYSRNSIPPVSYLCLFKGQEAKGFSAFQGRRGIASVVRWNLRLVVSGVESSRMQKAVRRVSFVFGYLVDVHADIRADVRGQNFSQALEALKKYAL